MIDRNADLDAFVDLVGHDAWQARIDAIVQSQPLPGMRQSLSGRDVLQRHAVEIAIERHRRRSARPLQVVDARIVSLATEALRLHAGLAPAGRRRFEERLEAAMLRGQSLTGLFHLLRTAFLQRSRGHEVGFAGLADGAPFDLVVSRDGARAEIACDTVSAEAGRGVHQGAWSRFVDLVNPDLRTWLGAHPGRYLLKMTLPAGLRVPGDGTTEASSELASLRSRITDMLAARRRVAQDERAVMRLDPLVVDMSRPVEPGVISMLRDQFGPETQLSVTVCGSGVFAMAAHAGGDNDVPAAVRRRMAEIAGSRLTGTVPGILAMFVEDIGLAEWRRLGREMSLEGETRQFLTTAAARHVVTVACTSRHELFDPNDEGREYRFRNASHRRQPGADPLGSSTSSACWSG